MNKNKLLIIVIVVILIILIVGVTIWFLTKNRSSEPIGENNIDYSVKDPGKLKQYIANLTDNYYIKYSGNFKDNAGEYTKAVIEYTKDGENFAFRSSEIDMYLICEKETLYSISHRYRIIIALGKNSIDTSEYNLASDIGQTFINAYKESIGSTEYDVEEYLYSGNSIKYYFKDNDIKLIKYNGQDIRIIRLEKQTNDDLFVKPSDYSFAIQ